MTARVYLDHNATSPLRPEARQAMMAALDLTGNPSSVHAEGREARAVVENARETIARIFGVKAAGVYFTSGGTEAANWLLQPRDGQSLAVSAVEHACVLSGHRFSRDYVQKVPVSADGPVELAALEAAIRPGALVAVQSANNETGVVQPVEEVARIAHARDARLICDAVQAAGRLPIGHLATADAIFLSAHKFGGPKGIGAVILRNGFSPAPLIRGGGQERRQRSGTENVAGIAGLAAALKVAISEQNAFAVRAAVLRQKLEDGLKILAPEAVIFGEGACRLPNTTCFAVSGKSAETMLIAFDLEGIAVSSGSACSSGKVERSNVLEAMGVPPELGAAAIRVSTGWRTAEADIERFLMVFEKICSGHRDRRAA